MDVHPARRTHRATLLAAVVLATVVVTADVDRPVGAVAGFGDVEDDRYYTEAVQWMVAEGITLGTTDTCFSPDRVISRGELAAFLYRMAGSPVGSPRHHFTDVVAPWHDAVSWMVRAGVTDGTSPTTFSPDAAVRRGELAVLLHRRAGSLPAPPHDFVDVAPWQDDAVSWMVDAGVTFGTSPITFSPDLPVTRAQVAAFLHRDAGRPATTVDPATPRCDLTRTPRRVTTTGFRPFATVGPVTLVHPADRVELVGFHESNHDGARQLEPAAGSAEWTTLESRDRGTGRRTSADIVVDPSAEIRAPVSGTVVRAGTYVLYCERRDEFVVIEPDDRPGWEVKLLHFEGRRVGPGDRVVAGETVVGDRATQLWFVSQVDERTTEPSWPHVHLEVVDPSIPDRPGSGC